ncbi:hypothetical protein [Nonomuraea dietziae]|uniref:hypothetical protein n=1 Tax=Nonomuraea dietziae TaxID=65515 RepID=UPI0031DC262F
MVKLANNCHTDLIYAYGNELALVAEQHPPGPPGGHSARPTSTTPAPTWPDPATWEGAASPRTPISCGPAPPPPWVGHARALNERLPSHVAGRLVDLIRETFGETRGRRLSVLAGPTRAGPPPTTCAAPPSSDMMRSSRAAGLTVLGHDRWSPTRSSASTAGSPSASTRPSPRPTPC